MKIQKDIISIGEILFDCYPEIKVLGGAPFNFLYNVWKLSAKGKFVSRVGENELGSEILDFLTGENFDVSFIQKDKNHKTGVVNVLLNENKIPEYVIEENAAYDFLQLEKSLENYLQKKECLIYFGTLAQRNEVSRNTIQKLFNGSAKFFYDINLRQNFYTKEILETSLKIADVIKLNEDELKTVNDLFIHSDFDIVETSQKLINKFGTELLCVTLGEKGALLFKEGKINKHKHQAYNIVDTVGAGDAYAAVLCLGYLMNWDLNRINILASEFAADICSIKGAISEDKNFYKKYTEILKNE